MRTTWSKVLVISLLATLSVSSGWTSDREEPGGQPASEDRDGGEHAEPPPVNTLKWTTASEVDNFGFDVYRGLAEDGPFERITAEPLAGAGTTDEPQHYVFVDEAIDPATDYFYYIESISLAGIREVFSPVIRAPAKRPNAAAEGDD